MTEIEKLDRIAIDVRSHKLLKQLLNENLEAGAVRFAKIAMAEKTDANKS